MVSVDGQVVDLGEYVDCFIEAKWIEGEFKNPFVDVKKGDWFYDVTQTRGCG